jgi:CRP/FNR family transcriptional regulator
MRMFCSLDDDALADFDLIGVSTTFPRGATLFLENAPNQAVYVVCTGQVKLSCTSKEGRTLILKIAMPGDILGLGAVISGSKYEVTAETVQPTEIKSIRRDEFLAFLKKHGDASLHAAKALSEEYKAAFFDARRLALSGSTAGRLAAVLLDWGRAESCGRSEMRARDHDAHAGTLQTREVDPDPRSLHPHSLPREAGTDIGLNRPQGGYRTYFFQLPNVSPHSRTVTYITAFDLETT